MKLSTKIFAGTAAVVALATAGMGWAHPDGMGWGPGQGMGPGYGMGYGMGPGMMGRGMGPGMMGHGPGYGMGGWMGGSEAGLAGYLASLKTELKITPEQEAAWGAFEAQARQQFASMQSMHTQMQQMHGPQAADKTPADFAALHEAMFKLRQANAEARAKAVKDLYAVLSTEQKAVADRNLGGGACAGWGGRGMRGGPGMPGCAFSN